MLASITLLQSCGGAELSRIQSLRYEVLRKPLGLPFSSALFGGDELDTTFHLLALLDGELVGCASLLTDPANSSFQLRGMAVAKARQGLGIGKRILEQVHSIAIEHGKSLWCNARIAAVPFYSSQGWVLGGMPFDLPAVGMHVAMRWPNRKNPPLE